MEIEKIRLENYRQYRDETINFSYEDKDKRFTVIQGAMGTGKTNLLNAITWCLYGRELHIDTKYKGLPIINTITLYQMQPGQTYEVKVELHLRDEQKKKAIFSRSLSCKKLENGDFKPLMDFKCDQKTGTKLEIKRQINRDMKIIEGEDAIYLTNKLFPVDIHEYFFFDGERLNDYFKKQTSSKLSTYENVVKREVFKISQIGLFEKVCEHLAKRRDFFAQQARGLNPEADEKKDQIDRAEKKLAEVKKDLEDKIKKKKNAETLEDKIAIELRNYPSSSEVNELQIERDELERKLLRINEGLEEERQNQLNYLIEVMTVIKGYKAISNANKLLSNKVESGDIPPDYKKKFIQQLIDRGRCICNTDISKECVEQEMVKKLLKECNELNEMSDELIRLNHELEQLIKDSYDFKKIQTAYSKKIKNLEDDEEEANKKLKRIGEKLEKIDDEAIKERESDYRKAKSQKEELISVISILNADIERLEKEISVYKVLYEKEVKKIEEKNELRKILLFCNKALEAASETKEEILEEIRNEIEKKTKKQFFEMIWKKENYKDVKIDDDYNFSVLDQKGRESIGTLSAGERQTLALSFMSALNMESGFDSPIVIDTPLGRISKAPKINIAKNLPNYLKGKQVTLLVTEEEYTDEVRNKLKNFVGLEHSISFKDTSEGSEAKVVPYV